MTILAQGNETISSVVFTSSAGFGTFAQLRISGIAAAVPEPSTLGDDAARLRRLGLCAPAITTQDVVRLTNDRSEVSKTAAMAVFSISRTPGGFNLG